MIMEEYANMTRVSSANAPQSRPLLGLTILMVEDSRYFADAVRLLAMHSGARIRRADCLTSARRHIKIYRPDIVLVDLGLPDGSGVEFIKELQSVGPILVAMSGISNGLERVRAMEAGADCFLEKPFFDLASFQQTLLSLLPEDIAPRKFTPRVAGQKVEPEQAALDEDLGEIAGLLKSALKEDDKLELSYCAQFLRTVARTAQDHDLMELATDLSSRLTGGDKWHDAAHSALELVEMRISETSNAALS